MKLSEVFMIDPDSNQIKARYDTVRWIKPPEMLTKIYVSSINQAHQEYPMIVQQLAEMPEEEALAVVDSITYRNKVLSKLKPAALEQRLRKRIPQVLYKATVCELYDAPSVGESLIDLESARLVYHNPSERVRVELILEDGGPSDPRVFEIVGSALYRYEADPSEVSAVSAYYTVYRPDGATGDEGEHVFIIVIGTKRPHPSSKAAVMITKEHAHRPSADVELGADEYWPLLGVYILLDPKEHESREIPNYMSWVLQEIEWSKIDMTKPSIVHMGIEAGMAPPILFHTMLALPSQYEFDKESSEPCYVPPLFYDLLRSLNRAIETNQRTTQL